MTRVRGDLSPPSQNGAYPQGVPSDLVSPAQAGEKILGLVAALTGVAVSSPVAEPDSVARVWSAHHSIASQSGSQSDSQSVDHTGLRVTDKLPRLRDPTGKSRDGNLSGGHAQSPVAPAHPHPAFKFQLASSQCPFSTGEPLEAVTPERHSAFLRPEISASIDLDSESDTPDLVDDDTSSGEEEEEEVVASCDRAFENRGRGIAAIKPQKERTAFKFNSDTTLKLHEIAIRERLQTADWNRLYRDKTGVYRLCIMMSCTA